MPGSCVRFLYHCYLPSGSVSQRFITVCRKSANFVASLVLSMCTLCHHDGMMNLGAVLPS